MPANRRCPRVNCSAQFTYFKKFAIAVVAMALVTLLAGTAQAGDTCIPQDATFHCVYAGNPTTATTFFYDADTGGSSGNTTTTIQVGDTVRWFESLANATFNAHTSTSGTCSGACTHTGTGPGGATLWDFPGSGNMATDTPYDFRFTAAGTYHYFCRPHGSGMQGTVVVNKGTANVVLTSPPNSSTFIYGQSITFTASVTFSGVTPTGTVNFIDQVSGATLATAGTSGGVATVAITTVPVGSYAVYASYSGDGNFFASTSVGTQSLTVNPASTSTALVDNGPSPSLAGQNVSFTATVSNSDLTGATPAGNVTFTDTGVPVVTLALSAGGTTTWTTSALAGGSHSITAGFHDPTLPNANFNDSTSSSVSQVVQDYTLSISNPALTTTPGPPGVTYNGTLTAFGGFNTPVALSCAAGGTAPPSPCTASPTPLAPTPGGAPFTVTATSATNFNYNFNIASNGGGLIRQQPVTLLVSSFSLGNPNPASVTSIQGNPSTPTSFTVSSQGFTGSVNLKCTGMTNGLLPAGVTCNFSQNPVALDSGKSVTVTMTISTTLATPVGSPTIEIHGTSGADVFKSITLNVTSSGTTYDVGVVSPISHANTPDPIAVGGPVEFDVTVQNFTTCPTTCVDTAAVTLVVDVDGPAQVTSAVFQSANCGVTGSVVTCTGNLLRGQQAIAAITVAAPFQRTLTATAQVSSTSADNNPGNNVLQSIPPALIRVRPLARKGLVPKQP